MSKKAEEPKAMTANNNKGKGKMAETSTTMRAKDEEESHRMRITSGGSMSAYVQFGLRYLRENPKTPLVLHTLPPPSPSPQAQPKSDKSQSESSGPSKPRSLTTLLPCTTTAPRLIAIVELIKREYIAQIRKDLQRTDPEGKGKGKGKGKGIWQYTECGNHVPPLQEHQEEVETMGDLTRVLGGRTKPKMTHSPYLQITLSTRPLGLEEKRNVSCQYVLARRKLRGKGKKAGKGKDANGNEEVEDVDVGKKLEEDKSQRISIEDNTASTEAVGSKADRIAAKRKSEGEDRPGKKAKTAKVV
ncbi:hypothetical protein CI109_101922 [Kwoniella shandongensis]|uniref:Uncharacterized protein n=1 Tax=Kwoniella shandongensis TaxID=1734106 RepID=A0A5M6BTX7_9TREE|nr:uncharacterized protein CI109_005418 [Kwoniella shandongensis]KAA5526294.1 hypothetical protein CI109_005418 [Kwoniella shandongensis]